MNELLLFAFILATVQWLIVTTDIITYSISKTEMYFWIPKTFLITYGWIHIESNWHLYFK